MRTFPPEPAWKVSLFDDQRLLGLCEGADKLGIDVPLGWPEAFVAAVTAHHRGDPWPMAGQKALCFRQTDLFVQARTRRWPLSVASSLITIPALRAAAILTALQGEGVGADRVGRHRVVEVYPAAALRQWGFCASGYKGAKGRATRAALVTRVLEQASWLTTSADVRGRCEADDNAFDALIAALVARAAAQGLCEPVPPDVEAVAAREGWIALPMPGSLERPGGGGESDGGLANHAGGPAAAQFLQCDPFFTLVCSRGRCIA